MTAKTINMMMILMRQFPTNDFEFDDDDYESYDNIASGGATISHQDRSGF